MTGTEVQELRARADRIRRLIVEMAHAADKGHIGSALSIADIMAVLATLRFGGGGGSSNGVLILSKGHAATALYAAMMDLDVLERDLTMYCADGSRVATHPMASVEGIDFSTGSLGQGITFAVGAALGASLSGRGDPVRCLLSDSELNEGSTWEAAQMAAAHRLGNLTVVLDMNGQQATARTDDVLPTGFAATAWEAMGWDVHDVDGHDVAAILESCEGSSSTARPRLVIARTTAGKGVSFMEARIAWHYLPLTDEQYSTAVSELSAGSA